MFILFLSIVFCMHTLFAYDEELTLCIHNKTNKVISIQGSNIPPQGAFMMENSAHLLLGNKHTINHDEQKKFSIPKECHSIALIEEDNDLCWTYDIPQSNKSIIIVTERNDFLIKDADKY